MTRVEEALRAGCPGVDLDLLNFGIGGIAVWDYKLLFELAGPTFDPDLVLVNLYLGNDGPDLFARPRRSGCPRLSGTSTSLATWSTWSGLRRVSSGTSRRGPEPTGVGASPARPWRRDRQRRRHRSSRTIRRLTGPIFTQEKFLEIMWDEYRRFARPSWAPAAERTWDPTLVDPRPPPASGRPGRGSRMMIALYPSVLQVYPEAREHLEAELRQRPERDRGGAARGRSPANRTVSCSSTAAARHSPATTRRRISSRPADNRPSRSTRRATRTGRSGAIASWPRPRPAGSVHSCVPTCGWVVVPSVLEGDQEPRRTG